MSIAKRESTRPKSKKSGKGKENNYMGMKLVIIADVERAPNSLEWADLDDALDQFSDNQHVWLLDEGKMTDEFWLSMKGE